MSSTQQKLILASLSTALGLGLCYAVLLSRGPGANVVLVDTREAVAGVFEARAKHPAPERGASAEKPAGLAVGSFDFSELEESVAREMFPAIGSPGDRTVYDPMCFFWNAPGYRKSMPPRGTYKQDFQIVNNNLGFRRVKDVASTQPDLRILVTGDSHTEGVVPMAAHFTELLEGALRADDKTKSVEVLNGGVGGYSFFNYLGVIEKFKQLKPDVVVVAIYGGNDFAGVRRLYRFFHRLPLGAVYPPELGRKVNWLIRKRKQLVGQFLHQAVTMHFQPEERDLIERATLELLGEIQASCERLDTQLVWLYIPALFDVQPHYQQEMIDEALELLEVEYGDMNHADRMADTIKQHASQQGVPFVDLREPYRQAQEFLYWGSDHHINVDGHRVAAEALEPVIRGLTTH